MRLTHEELIQLYAKWVTAEIFDETEEIEDVEDPEFKELIEGYLEPDGDDE